MWKKEIVLVFGPPASFTVFSTVMIRNGCVLMSRCALEVYWNGVVDTWTIIM